MERQTCRQKYRERQGISQSSKPRDRTGDTEILRERQIERERDRTANMQGERGRRIDRDSHRDTQRQTDRDSHGDRQTKNRIIVNESGALKRESTKMNVIFHCGANEISLSLI